MKTFKGRINLGTEAIKALSSMIEELKKEGDFVKVTPSGLVSQIVGHYFKTDFAKERTRLVKEYTDRREYLKIILRDVKSEEELDHALAKMAAKKHRGSTKEARA